MFALSSNLTEVSAFSCSHVFEALTMLQTEHRLDVHAVAFLSTTDWSAR